jgi:hypothetical protein
MQTINGNKPSTAIFTSTCEEAQHPKTTKAMQRIKDACDYLCEHDLPISIGEVGRFCKQTGPKTQSLRNNSDFRDYILARQGEQTLVVKAKPDRVKLATNDPQANAIIYALQTQAKIAEKRLANLKHALVNAGKYDLEAMTRTGKLVCFVGEPPTVSLDSGLANALRRLLDPGHLQKFGLSIKQDRVLGFNDRVFIEKGDLRLFMAGVNCQNETSLQMKIAPGGMSP